eukprot:1282668-Karenia_brevis.AAC.1
MAVTTRKSRSKTVRIDEEESPTGWQRGLDPEDIPTFKFGVYKGRPYTFVAESRNADEQEWISERKQDKNPA